MSKPKMDELASGGETSPPGPDRSLDESGTLGALTRLLVASALLGRDAIGSAVASSAKVSREQAAPLPGGQPASNDSLPATTGIPRPTPSPRHLLIGALFDTGERIERRGASALRLAGKAAAPAVRWARQSRLTAPARRRFDALAARGEAQMRHWVERGVVEEQRSLALLNATASQVANTSLDRVVESPQVQGLVEEFVQAQGQSLGRRFLQELRALAVSGDRSVARLARRVVRHPRSEVPPFPRGVPAPPSEAPLARGLRGHTAGFVSRLLAFLIDVIVISILIRATGWLLQDIRMVTGASFYLPALTTADLAMPIEVTVIGGLLLSSAYFVFFWTVAGLTPGKALMGLCVVARDGRHMSLSRSVVRLAGYWVSLLLYGLGYWWVAVDNWREGWHDKIARTAVIYVWDAYPSDRSLSSLVGAPEDRL